VKKRIYLDVCCLNRPYDDQSQARIRLESEAVLLIIQATRRDACVWIGSDVLTFEIEQTPNRERRIRIHYLTQDAHEKIELMDQIAERAEAIQTLGFGGYDALHLASAEAGKADVFLTTDDKLLKRAKRFADQLNVDVTNPTLWALEDEHDG
jgi:hypothetical protein